MISERNTDLLFKASKDIGLVVNLGKIRYMEVERHRGMMANEHIRADINSYEKAKTFIYLASLLTNQNYTHEQIKCNTKNRKSMLLFSSDTFVLSNFL